MSNNQTASRQNNRYQNNRYQNKRPQNNRSQNQRSQNNGGHGNQNNGPRANGNGLQMPPNFLLYAFAFVAVASALFGGWVGHSVMKPKTETDVVMCENTGGLLGTNCW